MDKIYFEDLEEGQVFTGDACRLALGKCQVDHILVANAGTFMPGLGPLTDETVGRAVTPDLWSRLSPGESR